MLPHRLAQPHVRRPGFGVLEVLIAVIVIGALLAGGSCAKEIRDGAPRTGSGVDGDVERWQWTWTGPRSEAEIAASDRRSLATWAMLAATVQSHDDYARQYAATHGRMPGEWKSTTERPDGVQVVGTYEGDRYSVTVIDTAGGLACHHRAELQRGTYVPAAEPVCIRRGYRLKPARVARDSGTTIVLDSAPLPAGLDTILRQKAAIAAQAP